MPYPQSQHSHLCPPAALFPTPSSPLHSSSEIALHSVSVIVHRTMTLDDGTKVWEALDDGNWATLKIYQEVRRRLFSAVA